MPEQITKYSDPSRCSGCGEKLPEWRREHTNKCAECEFARCGRCGQNVENMDDTSNGGFCIPCAKDVYGSKA